MFCLEDEVPSLKRTRAGMKHPVSPVSLEYKPSTGPKPCVSNCYGDADPHPASECKQQSVMQCEVCNIQLNSRIQAQTHYNGKAHLRRLCKTNQDQSSGGVNTAPGSPIQGGTLLTSLPLPGRTLQSPLDLKRFLSLQVNGSTPLSLFPNIHTTDPVQKAVINHTFGLPQPIRKKQIISCNVCHLRFNSTSQAEGHYRGHKHARRLKIKQRGRMLHTGRDRHAPTQQEEGTTCNTPALDSSPLERTVSLCDSQAAHLRTEVAGIETGIAALTPICEASSLGATLPSFPEISCRSQDSASLRIKASVPEPGSLGSEWTPHPAGQQSAARAEEEEAVGRKNLHCAICKVTVNSSSQLYAHYHGSKHKLMLEGQSVQPRRRGGKVVSSHLNPRPKRHGNKNNATSIHQLHHCDVCDIAVNSETQLKQHLSSRRHKDRLSGKPPKSKFSQHRSSAHPLLTNVGLTGLSATGSAFQGVNQPYSLTTASPQAKLALHKELSRTLAGFLPSPLTSATLCTMATNPLTLRHTATPAAIIQTPLLTPGLFRPAPGPLRATHAPIIFSPY